MPTTFSTARLDLRPPVADDAEAIFVYAGDPLATRYMVWPTAGELEDVQEFLEDVAWGWSEGDDFGYVLVEKDSGTLIGMASCQFADEGAEIGFILRPDRWGQGLATEAAGAIMAAARRIDDLYRIWASCDVDNPASRAVLERLGMVYEGRLRRRSARPNLPGANGPRDDVIMAWVRD